MPPRSSSRRSRSVSDDESGDVDNASSSKRARTNDHSGSSSPESDMPSRNPQSDLRNKDGNSESDDEDRDPDKFQPGAIVRVKLNNFITYEKAEFFPGPNLNMVIGPNGTGKSSLVCAICLGLGWSPKHLGRAGEIGEFVKHTMPDASIEVELKGKDDSGNYVVRLRIIREKNDREWWLNGVKTSLKAVQQLTKSLSIQIDNLCQFLPQDKVHSFSALSPVDLLFQTQRAAAEPYMLDWHEKLKNYREEQKKLEIKNLDDKDRLEGFQTRQQNLQAEVDKLQERRDIQENVDKLKKTIPFVEYSKARADHNEFKKKKRDAQQQFAELKKRIEPSLRSIAEKEAYQKQLDDVVKHRKLAISLAEKGADEVIQKINELEEESKEHEGRAEAEQQADQRRRKDWQKTQRNITNMKASLNQPAIEFVPSDWNDRIRPKEVEIRSINSELGETNSRMRDLKSTGIELRAQIDAAERELGAFDTQEGQLMGRLERLSRESAQAWTWIQENRGAFEAEVYGPPLITCSIKDPAFADAVEAMLKKNDFLAFTVQTKNDMKKLSAQLQDTMKFSDVVIRNIYDPISAKRPYSTEQLQSLGFEGWAIDYIDGPQPVLAMLCQSSSLHVSAVGHRELDDGSYNRIAQVDGMSKWVAGRSHYVIARRREYGPTATSTTTKMIAPARHWTNQTVDTSARQEIVRRKEEIEDEFSSTKAEYSPLKKKIDDFGEKKKELEAEIAVLKKEKAELQDAYSKRQALPDKISREEEELEKKKESSADSKKEIFQHRVKQDYVLMRRAEWAVKYKDAIAKIRARHEELLEAQIRLIEAESDVVGLKEQNVDIVQQRDEEYVKVRQAEQDSKKCTELAQAAINVCNELLADPDNEAFIEECKNPPEGTTVESLGIEIAAEESKLDYMHVNNPNAIRDYERRQKDVNELTEQIAKVDHHLGKLAQKITQYRNRWEPELDELVKTISEAFSYNFEQIGCAGNVSVHKDEDFSLWAIHIKVKFRENEDLQILDPHRQSGGERSVSTIFFLMSLQSLARAPFRVVDEINQGMDPRNERMVHERMVEIACKEHTSQYFLITPKLLTGLRYDKRMKVLCITSGEHMPSDYKNLDLSKIIGIRRAILAAG